MESFMLTGSLLALLATACNSNNTTIDSTTGNAAAAADTVGAHQMLAKDAAGVRLDSAEAKSINGLGGIGTDTTTTGTTSPQDR